MMQHIGEFRALGRHRFRWYELIWWGAALAFFFLFPDYRSFGTSVLIMAMLALSLGLALGFAGIISLGHAVYFGIGAYMAGRLALAGWTEPVTGLLIAGIAAGLVAAILGAAILRLSGLPLLMVTLALGVIAFEAANKATSITGGDDGLFGIQLSPLFGRFEWSIFGTVQYLYSLTWLLLVFLLVRRFVASPFGLSLEGIRENPLRMALLGTAVRRQLVITYAFSGLIAGIAGALSAQTTAFVGLQVLSVETSVDALIMVVLGGVGSIYGGLLGAPLYMAVKYFTQHWNPFYWMLVVGLLLIVTTLFARGGISALLSRLQARLDSMQRSRS